MSSERRKYLRVFFEETIQVEANDWADPMATGLDISLNGVRFHCERALDTGEQVSIIFPPSLKFKGVVRWCWPIEWYYQAAIEFDVNTIDQSAYRQYIMEVTGEPYPEYIDEEDFSFEDEEQIDLEQTEEKVFMSEEAEEQRFLQEEEKNPMQYPAIDRVNPLSFMDYRILLIEANHARQDHIREYLSARCHFFIETCDDYSSGWDAFNFSPPNAVVVTWINEDVTIDLIQKFREHDKKSKIIVLAGMISLEQRLDLIYFGASDVLTLPLQVSSLAQSLVIHFSKY